jgi:hypothetical protein
MKAWNKRLAVGLVGATAVFLSSAAYADDAEYHNTNRENYPDLYHANEFSLDVFGTGSVGENTISHISGDRISHNGRLGAGLGVNYFFTRNVGIGVDAFSVNTQHSFVDNLTGNLLIRFPIRDTIFAPYIYGGGGYQFDYGKQAFGDGGAGVEFRFAQHVGFFLDARYVMAAKTDNFGVGRAGFRFSF